MSSKSKPERSLQTDSNSTIRLWPTSSQTSGSISTRTKPCKKIDIDMDSKLHVAKTAAQQDLANRILHRLKNLPEISEGPSRGVAHTDPTHDSPTNTASQPPPQELRGKGVTADQLAAYLSATEKSPPPQEKLQGDDALARARIDHVPRHWYLQPPKCIAHLAGHTSASIAVAPTSCGTQEEASSAVSSSEDGEDSVPLFAPQVKPKPTNISVLQVTGATTVPLDQSYGADNVIDPLAA